MSRVLKKNEKNNKSGIIQDKNLEIAISPINLRYYLNKVEIGSSIGQCLGITQYHQELNYAWLSDMNTKKTVSRFIYIPQSETDFIGALSRNIKVNLALVNSSSDPVEISNAKNKIETYEKVLNAISKDAESVGMIISLFMPNVLFEEELNDTCGQVLDAIASAKCKGRIASNLQEQALKTISPYYFYQKEISETFGRVSLASSFWASLPFCSAGFSDGAGYYFAKDLNQFPIILNTWKRGGDRTNSNWTILGKPGSGKSTCLKHMILNEYAIGTKVIIIDPENEYSEETKNLGGHVINAGGGSKDGLINPLQIRPAPTDCDDEIDTKLYSNTSNTRGSGDLSLHLKTLEVFFRLYLESITEIQLAILMNTLEELYLKFNINWDTDINNLTNEEFPILSDLYDLLLQKSNDFDETRKDFDENHFKNLSILIRSIAIGQDSNLFNGYTTLESDEDIICLNTFNLQNTSDRIRRTQYYNILTWCWQQITQNRDINTMLYIDEGYLLIDPNIIESLLYLRNISKRIRKYGGGVAIASHSIIDFSDEKIKLYGYALLNLADYKVFYGGSGKDILELVEAFNLSDSYADTLRKNTRGMGLLLVNDQIIRFNQVIPDYEWQYIGNRGGK